MTGDQIASFAYLVLLGSAVTGWLFLQSRQSRSKLVQQAAIWGLIFVGVIAAVGLWSDIRRDVLPRQEFVSSQEIRIPRQPDGHYYLSLNVNGAAIRFMVDTGATQIVLSRSDAQRAGIEVADLAFLGTARTANGTVRTAPVWLQQLTIGPLSFDSIRAVVNEGALDTSLLGMSFLNQFDSIEIRGSELILRY